MNDPVARAESIQPLWVQLVDPASPVLAENRPQVWAHNGERCAPWMHQNRAGFVYALSMSYYWRDPSQLTVSRIRYQVYRTTRFLQYSNSKLDRHKTGKKQYI